MRKKAKISSRQFPVFSAVVHNPGSLVDHIVEDTGLGVRLVRNVLTELVELGEVVVRTPAEAGSMMPGLRYYHRSYILAQAH